MFFFNGKIKKIDLLKIFFFLKLNGSCFILKIRTEINEKDKNNNLKKGDVKKNTRVNLARVNKKTRQQN